VFAVAVRHPDLLPERRLLGFHAGAHYGPSRWLCSCIRHISHVFLCSGRAESVNEVIKDVENRSDLRRPCSLRSVRDRKSLAAMAVDDVGVPDADNKRCHVLLIMKVLTKLEAASQLARKVLFITVSRPLDFASLVQSITLKASARSRRSDCGSVRHISYVALHLLVCPTRE
jgi:hypothetical protein